MTSNPLPAPWNKFVPFLQRLVIWALFFGALWALRPFFFLVFLTFYVPCLSTFALMLKTLGRKEAWFSVAVSLASALLLAGVGRWALELTPHVS